MEVMSAMISAAELDSIVHAYHGNIFAILGPHQMHSGNYAVRTFLPEADSVTVIDRHTQHPIKKLNKIPIASDLESSKIQIPRILTVDDPAADLSRRATPTMSG